MGYEDRLSELRDQVDVLMGTFLGIPLMARSYDEDAAAATIPGGGWQFRAHLRELILDSNESEMVAAVKVLMHASIDDVVTTEDAFLESAWTIQEAVVDPAYWDGLDAVKAVVDGEPPEVSEITLTGDVYSWSVDVALILVAP